MTAARIMAILQNKLLLKLLIYGGTTLIISGMIALAGIAEDTERPNPSEGLFDDPIFIPLIIVFIGISLAVLGLVIRRGKRGHH